MYTIKEANNRKETAHKKIVEEIPALPSLKASIFNLFQFIFDSNVSETKNGGAGALALLELG